MQDLVKKTKQKYKQVSRTVKVWLKKKKNQRKAYLVGSILITACLITSVVALGVSQFRLQSQYIDTNETLKEIGREKDLLDKAIEAKDKVIESKNKEIEKEREKLSGDVERLEKRLDELKTLVPGGGRGGVNPTASVVERINYIGEEIEYVEELTVVQDKISPTRYGNRYAAGNCTFYVYTKRGDIGSFWGDAKHWINSAKAEGFSTGSSPKRGAVAVSYQGYYGHVAYVEKISSDGSAVFVTEMNAPINGVVTSGWYRSSDFQYIYSLN